MAMNIHIGYIVSDKHVLVISHVFKFKNTVPIYEGRNRLGLFLDAINEILSSANLARLRYPLSLISLFS